MADDRVFPLLDAEDVVGTETALELVRHLYAVWVNPEVLRRRAAGLLPSDEPLKVNAIQVLFKDNATEVRFNQEIRGYARLSGPVDTSNGAPPSSEYMYKAKNFELFEDEFDFSHVTMLRISNEPEKWGYFFNPLRNRRLAGQFVENGKAFLRVARFSFDEGLCGPCVDTLFSACELACKAHLLLAANAAGRAETHKAIHTASNLASKDGRMPRKIVTIFNRLAQLRHLARYSVGHQGMLGVELSDLDHVAGELGDLTADCVNRGD